MYLFVPYHREQHLAPTQTAMNDTFHEKETMHGTDKRPPTWVLLHRKVV